MRITASGAPLFLKRYGHLFKALTRQFGEMDYAPGLTFTTPQRVAQRIRSELHARGWSRFLSKVEHFVPLSAWDARVYQVRSLDAEARITSLPNRPDLIVHVFGMYAPLWSDYSIPYAMILDYTEALAKRNWPEWAPFVSDEAWEAWWECEHRAYSNAAHLFPFGRQTRRSLIEDYGIKPEKITVIGSGGYFDQLYAGDRTFGSKRILFYSADGVETLRKGADRVMTAFRMVRQQIPEAKLVVVGRRKPLREPGVENHGWVSSEEMRELFLTSDVVVAPSRCDPFPGFLIEAMNFGVPCIVSDADGMPEIVSHEVTGIVLPEASGERLGAEVVRLLGDSRRLMEMSEQSRRKVQELNWNWIAEVMAQTIRKLPRFAATDTRAEIRAVTADPITTVKASTARANISPISPA